MQRKKGERFIKDSSWICERKRGIDVCMGSMTTEDWVRITEKSLTKEKQKNWYEGRGQHIRSV